MKSARKRQRCYGPVSWTDEGVVETVQEIGALLTGVEGLSPRARFSGSVTY